MWLLGITLVSLLLFVKLISSYSWRLSFCLALQAFALLSWLGVEVFGYFDSINFLNLFIFWICITIPASYYNFKNRYRLLGLATENLVSFKFLWLTGLIFLLTFLSGILYAPNTIDSTVYHLTRIEFWLQHRNIDYFATQTDRMLYQPPLAEYMILQFRILQDSDTFSFIIQWLFALGACVGVSLLAEIAGAKKKTQYIAFFVSATIPMVVLQSSSTQNDVTVSFFIVMAAYFLLKNLSDGKSLSAILTGISIGEAILTKGTAYVFLFPICMYWGIVTLKNVYLKKTSFGIQLRNLSLFILPFLIICGSFYYRNFVLIGSPLGVSKELFYVYNNQTHTLSSFISVIIRNISLHFSVPGIHLISEKIIFFIHEKVLGLSVNDPSTSFTPFDLPMLGMTEDNAGNFFHFILFFPAIIYVTKHKNTNLRAITVFGLISFLLFCFQIKFQIWHSRLHIPIFLLMSVPTAFFLANFKYSNISLVFLGLSGVFFALFCFNRPIVKFPPLTTNTYLTSPKIAQFYHMEEEKGKQMSTLIAFLKEKKFKKIAVKSEEKYGNDILYPVMYELRHQSIFYPVQMTNQTRVLYSPTHAYDAVLFFTNTPQESLDLDKKYKKIAINAGNLYIFVP